MGGMVTDWKWRLFLFVREADVTPENKQAFAAIYADNTSGETMEDEGNLFDSAVKLSVSGELPPQVRGLNTAVKTVMRADMQSFLDSLPQSRYYAIANTELPQHFEGELLQSNKPDETRTGQLFTWDNALQDLFDERGLQVIPDENI